VEFISESTEFAVYENEKPLVIRSILKKKWLIQYHTR
jgi:hypothetical protein